MAAPDSEDLRTAGFRAGEDLRVAVWAVADHLVAGEKSEGPAAARPNFN